MYKYCRNIIVRGLIRLFAFCITFISIVAFPATLFITLLMVEDENDYITELKDYFYYFGFEGMIKGRF